MSAGLCSSLEAPDTGSCPSSLAHGPSIFKTREGRLSVSRDAVPGCVPPIYDPCDCVEPIWIIQIINLPIEG